VPSEYALTAKLDHPRNVYVREQDVVPALDQGLAQIFDSDTITETAHLLAAAGQSSPADEAALGAAQRALKDCDRKLAQYRQTLEAGGDPIEVAKWINEVKAKRLDAERRLADLAPQQPLSAADIEEPLAGVPDKVALLADADPELKQRLYSELDLTLTYHPGEHLVRVEARPWGSVRVGGPSRTISTREIREQVPLLLAS
jgi:hypothetical protein